MIKFIRLSCVLICSPLLLIGCNNGSTSSSTNSPQTFSSISNGGGTVCGISQNDNTYCWGSNIYGQLGNGTYISESTPIAVIESLSGKFSSISVAESSVCALNTNGKVYCWGNNRYGQLGTGSTESNIATPSAVLGNLTYTKISAGLYHACGITTNGSAYCWGQNQYGQLGNGSINNESSPTLVSGNLSFKAIDAGGYVTCAITVTNKTYCWGGNLFGQLGNGNNVNESTPTEVIESTSGIFTQISVSQYSSCGVNTNGTAYCWGGNLFGQLGNGANTDSNVPVAVIESVSGGFKQISVGRYHTCGINLHNQGFCWGGDLYGQLGDGTNTDSNIPVAVIESISGSFKQISAGRNSTCGINTNNQGFCWGNNTAGQLGNGSYVNESTPVAINASIVD